MRSLPVIESRARPSALIPVPRPRSRMLAGDRQRQLLRVAIDIFARNGFSGTKTKDIALAAGVSEASLFHHFATKEDLYHAILDMQEEGAKPAERKRELQDFMDRRDDVGLLRGLANGILESFAKDPAFQRLMLYASLEGHLMANLFRERFVLPTGTLFEKYISVRQKEGAFRPVDPRVATMFAIGTFVHYAMSRHVFAMKKEHPGDAKTVEGLVQMVHAGLAVSGPRAGAGKRSPKKKAGARKSPRA